MAVHVQNTVPVAGIVLDRAKANAFDVEQLADLCQALETVAKLDGLRAVLLRAEGQVAFSAGADLGATGPLAEPGGIARWTANARAMLDRVATFPVPIIAVIRRPAAGGGFELALACQFRIMATDAHLSLPEVNRGYLPSWGAVERLMPLLGPARVLDLVVTGRRIDAQEAQSLGLVHRVADDPDEEAQTLADAIATKPPLAVQAALAQVSAAGLDSRSELRARELSDLERLVRTEDTVEGVMAFFEKRQPTFKGR